MDLSEDPARDADPNVKRVDTFRALRNRHVVLHGLAVPPCGFVAMTNGGVETMNMGHLLRQSAPTRNTIRYMSIYRQFNRVPPDDLHHFKRQRSASNEPGLPESTD